MDIQEKVELTKSIIANAVCDPKKSFIYIMDSKESGFGIRVTPKGTKQYVIRFQYKGKRISKSFAPVEKLSLQAARTRAKELMTEYILGKDPLKSNSSKKRDTYSFTILELFEVWKSWSKEQGVKRDSVQTMMYCLRQYVKVDRKKAETLTSFDIEGFRSARIKAGLKPSTVNRTVRELKYLYNWGKESGYLQDSYVFPKIKMLSESEISPKIHYLTQEEIDALLAEVNKEIKRKPKNEYLKDIILFALNTGIRPASICGLQRRDVLRLESDGGEIRLRAANIKTKKDLNLPISAAAASVLSKRLSKDGEDEDAVFTTFTSSYICKRIKKLMLAAGLDPQYSAYTLRHNYATSLYRQGASPTEIQIQMCHSSYRSTQKYVHADYEHQKDVANLLKFDIKENEETD